MFKNKTKQNVLATSERKLFRIYPHTGTKALVPIPLKSTTARPPPMVQTPVLNYQFQVPLKSPVWAPLHEIKQKKLDSFTFQHTIT